jgi:pimeloyl-ACP methyl ester carboxylesterase
MQEPLPGSAVTLHGGDLHYVDAGRGPAVVFIHGLLGSHRSWTHLVDEIAVERRVVAPDLFGHGASSKPMGDYSLGAHAATLRDLLDHLGISTATLVGHSLGGGIALQFSYLFPERVDRLVLVSSGGLGRELSLLLRAPALPGAGWVLPFAASSWFRRGGETFFHGLSRLGLNGASDYAEAWRGFESLGDNESRRAFLATARAVIDPGGQTVNATASLHLAATVPTLIVWGARDRMIPSWHAVNAQQAIEGSRVEIFERAGHFPHLDEPVRFASVLNEFIVEDPARVRRKRRA